MTTEDLKNYLKANKYSDDMCDYACNVLKVCVGRWASDFLGC